MTLAYSITAANPEAHLFSVRFEISEALQAGQSFSLPAWIPGSYMIRDFAKHIVNLSAQSNGQAVALTKIDKDSWQIEQACDALQLDYQIYAFDLSVRSAHLDSTHGFFNGTSVFLRLHGFEDKPCHIHIAKPPAEKYKHWRIATSLLNKNALLATKASTCAFGDFVAENYYDLIEHPVEMGDFDWLAFEACGVPHYVALTGRHNADTTRLLSDLTRICEHHIRFFGEPAPMDRYVFLVTITGDGYGGLEHTHSTALLCSRKHMPVKNNKAVTHGYREFLGLCSHEYFHTWNVKRIKPAVFTHYDLNKENYTEQLWAFEGITSYYDDLALVRTGIISGESYLELLSQTLTRLQQNLGRHQQSVTDSSFYAWTKFYKQDENAINAIVSYYTKGAVIALLIDLKLRHLTDKSLDDVMRQLWQHYLQAQLANDYHGLEAQSIEKLITQCLAQYLPDEDDSNTIENFTLFLQKALYSTAELPLVELLNTVGIRVQFTTAYQKKTTVDIDDTDLPASLGVRFVNDRVINGSLPTITHIYNNSAGEKAGLAVNDCIIAINGLRAQAADIEQQLANMPLGEKVEIAAFRRDELMHFELVLEPAHKDKAILSMRDDNASATSARQHWLSS